MWFFKKKAITALCVEIFDVIVKGNLNAYQRYAGDMFGCTPEMVADSVPLHWADYEAGLSTTEEFWDRVGQTLKEKGVVHQTPGWKLKGVWQAVVEENFKLNSELLANLYQVRAAKIWTVACTNMPSEIATAFQKMGAFEPFNLSVISSQIQTRKPSPDFFIRTCKLARSKPSQCLYLDKDSGNLAAAQQVGLKTLRYTDDPHDTRWQLLQMGLMR